MGYTAGGLQDLLDRFRDGDAAGGGAGAEPAPGDPGYLAWLTRTYPPRPGYAYRETVDQYGGLVVDEYPLEGDASGGAGAAASRYNAELDYQLGLKQLEVDWAQTRIQQAVAAESSRANKAQEAEMARGRALDAASQAAGSYLEGTRLADQRRLASFQEARELLPFLTTPGQKYQAGLEPGGALAAVMGRRGLPFTPMELPKKTMFPGELAEAPSEQQIGAGVLQQIAPIRAAGARGVP